jgi:hypothetical protein
MIKLRTPSKAWFGQITTGGGFAALLGTISAVLTGQMQWPQAVPLLVAGVVGVLWPETKSPAPRPFEAPQEKAANGTQAEGSRSTPCGASSQSQPKAHTSQRGRTSLNSRTGIARSYKPPIDAHCGRRRRTEAGLTVHART